MSEKSNKKFRKGNLNPGEAEVMDYKGQLSIKLGDKFQWVRIAPPRTPGGNDKSIRRPPDIRSSGADP